MRARELLWRTYRRWVADGGARLSAAVAYHALFALAPLALVAVAVAGWFYGDEAASGTVATFLEAAIGADGARVAESLVMDASSPSSVAAGMVGAVLTLYGSARAFIHLQGALNSIWGVTIRPGTPWWRVLLAKLVPFGLVAVGIAGLVVALGARSLLGRAVDAGLVSATWLASGRTLPILMLFGAFLLITVVFKALPDVRIAWRDVWTGAAIATLLSATATWGLQQYLVRTGGTSVYGVAGSFVAVLLWIHLVVQMVLLGAEMTEVHAEMRGDPIRPAPYAVRVRRVLDVPDELDEAHAPDAEDPSVKG